jgi:hypothetical protein
MYYVFHKVIVLWDSLMREEKDSSESLWHIFCPHCSSHWNIKVLKHFEVAETGFTLLSQGCTGANIESSVGILVGFWFGCLGLNPGLCALFSYDHSPTAGILSTVEFNTGMYLTRCWKSLRSRGHCSCHDTARISASHLPPPHRPLLDLGTRLDLAAGAASVASGNLAVVTRHWNPCSCCSDL